MELYFQFFNGNELGKTLTNVSFSKLNFWHWVKYEILENAMRDIVSVIYL